MHKSNSGQLVWTLFVDEIVLNKVLANKLGTAYQINIVTYPVSSKKLFAVDNTFSF